MSCRPARIGCGRSSPDAKPCCPSAPPTGGLGADQTAFTGYDNGLVSTLSPSGEETITNNSGGTVDVQVDVTGYFQAPVEPGEPLGVAATVSGSSATVTWAAPNDDGGSPATGYTIAASPDTASVQVGPGISQATLSGLSQAAADTFTVTATNAIGAGMAGTADGDTCVPIASESFSDSDTADAQAYWTDANLANAADDTSDGVGAAIDAGVQDGDIPPGTPLAATGDCPALTGAPGTTSASAVVPQDPAASHPFVGFPTVGKLFFKVAHVGPANCTATVVNDSNTNPKFSLVVTAAHCIETAHACSLLQFSDYMFAPKWHDNTFPYGRWYPRNIYVDPRWISDDMGCFSENARYDYAMIVLSRQKDSGGILRGVGYYTGLDAWRISMPPRKNVTIVGIPGSDAKPLRVNAESHTISACNVGSNVLNRTASTPGFGSGSSGGPWFYKYNYSEQVGWLLGIISGCKDGGPDDNTSYSTVWRSDFSTFLNFIANNRE